eukprot:m.266385 g.266385  ORF g.266385 m.266385 type:complete len:90 (+) comp30653_c0_seq1:38-307(+)
MWECGSCTFQNTSGFKCQICSTPRGSSSRINSSATQSVEEQRQLLAMLNEKDQKRRKPLKTAVTIKNKTIIIRASATAWPSRRPSASSS